MYIRGKIKKSSAIPYDRLNVDKFYLSQMLPTHICSVV